MQQLWQRGLHLITGIRRDMKNHLVPLLDKLLLRKRFIIETLLVKLKSHMGLEHTRHRSPSNALVHIFSWAPLKMPLSKRGRRDLPEKEQEAAQEEP